MGSFVGFEIEFGLNFVSGVFVRLASGAMMIVMIVMWVFNLVILVFTVVLQSESIALGVFSLRVDELQLMLVASDFDWVRQVLLVFFLDVHGHSMIVNEFN